MGPYAAKTKCMALASACLLARAFLVPQNMVAALHGETQQYPSLHLASPCKPTNTTMGVSYTHLNLTTHPRASEPTTTTDIRNLEISQQRNMERTNSNHDNYCTSNSPKHPMDVIYLAPKNCNF